VCGGVIMVVWVIMVVYGLLRVKVLWRVIMGIMEDFYGIMEGYDGISVSSPLCFVPVLWCGVSLNLYMTGSRMVPFTDCMSILARRQ
jgi:hypothetical protein